MNYKLIKNLLVKYLLVYYNKMHFNSPLELAGPLNPPKQADYFFWKCRDNSFQSVLFSRTAEKAVVVLSL